MPVKDRDKLKNVFSKGSIPKQEDFGDLIDSFVHKEEDEWFDQNLGFRLRPANKSCKLLSFCKNASDRSPVLSVEKHPKDEDNFGLNLVDSNGESKFFVNNNGNVGVGKTDPQSKLDVNGNFQSCGRRGTYVNGKVLADGEWHPIITGLSDCHIFEVVAKFSKYGCGVHSLLYAIAMNAFQGYRGEIKEIHTHYEPRDRIELRWMGDDFNYRLEIKSRKNHVGDEKEENKCMIEYYITNLWW